jgi:Rab3 GTPase-activating protein catalytic subunit
MTANEELFDDEFYQEDFSTASVFEAFVSRLSELFENYENFDKEPLHKNQLSLCDWTEEDENISFNEFELTVTRYKCKLNGSDELMETSSSAIDTVFQDLTSMENDYCLLDVRHFKRDPDSTSSKFIHPIAVWYGLRDFAVVRCRRKILYDMSDIKMLQSAMNLAVIDSKCKIPTFIQIMDPEQNVFVGVYDNCEHRVSFEIAHLKVPPPSCKYLSGLLDIFRGKVDIAYQNPAIVSVCLGYSVKNFSSLTFVTQKSNEIDDWDMTDFFGTISTLPFGISSDPVSELILYTKWPQVTENVVFDSQTYSDFNPLNAPKWSLRFRYDTTPVTFLADTLHEYCTLTESPEALYEYYGFLATKNRSFENARNPFAALTDSKIPSLPNVFEQPSYTIEGPISEEQMNGILEFVLPDERLASYQYKISESDEKMYDPLRMKSSPPDSVITRLSVILANIYTTFGGRRGVAQFWTEFSQRIRMRFDDGKIIPG